MTNGVLIVSYRLSLLCLKKICLAQERYVLPGVQPQPDCFVREQQYHDLLTRCPASPLLLTCQLMSSGSQYFP